MSVLVSPRQFNNLCCVLKYSLEARKADLRRVEMELDEADEMVLAYHMNGLLTSILMTALGRFHKWKLKFKEFQIP